MNKPKIIPYICLVLTLISLIPNLVFAQQELNNYQKIASLILSLPAWRTVSLTSFMV